MMAPGRRPLETYARRTVTVHGSVGTSSAALAIDRDDALRRHLLEADSGGFIRKRPSPPVGQGHVACDIIALVLAHQDAACIDKFFAQSIGHDLEAR
jgi:hypothetical protein